MCHPSVKLRLTAASSGPVKLAETELRAALKAKLEEPVGVAGAGGGMSAQGCADASLYRRFQHAGLQAMEGGPAWAWNWARPDNVVWRSYLEQQIRDILTPAEDQTWLRALQQAQADGLPVWIARPFHCAVGTKP